MSAKHSFLTRIDKQLWEDITKLKNLEGGTSTINGYVHEGLRYVRDTHLQNMTVQRKKRETLKVIYG